MTVSTLTNISLILVSTLVLQACQLPYLATGAYEQAKILNARRAVKKVINDENVSEQTKEKLEFALKAQSYSETQGLKCKGNFKSFVQLDRPYVTYLLIASKKNELKAKTWWFPVVGSFPYKGYFSEEKALKAAQRLQKKDYDTYVRGVTAYSSLGWFKEPILSSMTAGSKLDLADTIFHECFHSTVFYKNEVEKNEQLAVFFAHNILISFLKNFDQEEEIPEVEKAWEDQLLFSNFLNEQIQLAEKSYSNGEQQEEILKKIASSYQEKLKPQLNVLSFDSVFLEGLNNAKLVAFKTYFHDFEELQRKLKEDYDNDIFSFLEFLKKSS